MFGQRKRTRYDHHDKNHRHGGRGFDDGGLRLHGGRLAQVVARDESIITNTVHHTATPHRPSLGIPAVLVRRWAICLGFVAAMVGDIRERFMYDKLRVAATWYLNHCGMLGRAILLAQADTRRNRWRRYWTAGLLLGACAVGAPVLAYDYSASIIGLTPTAIANNYNNVVAMNLAATPAGSGARVKYQTMREHMYDCRNTPSGRVQACITAGQVFTMFATSPTCNGNGDCALAETRVYFAKNKNLVQAILALAALVSVYQLGEQAEHLIFETVHWCVNSVYCSESQMASCEMNGYSCTNPLWFNDYVDIEDGVAELSSNLLSYGEYETALDSGLGMPVAELGAGSWGVTSEMEPPSSAGCGPNGC